MLAKIAAVIATLADTNGSSESMLYIFFDMNMDTWTKVRQILVESGLITIKGNFVTLTESGRETAAKLNHAIGDKKNV